MSRTLASLLSALLLAACASPDAAAPANGMSQVERRLLDLEQRVERLEDRPLAKHPNRDRAEIQAHIQSLEAERAKLLVKYTDQHPAVRDIDRRLLILNEQLGMVEK
jgi:hypothetical protein